VTRLQSGDEASLAAWGRICEASRREFNAIYGRLGVTLTERGESFYNPQLKGVVEELKEKGIAVESEGATCVFVEGKEVPLIVQKSDGGFGYASTDMAAIKQRLTQARGRGGGGAPGGRRLRAVHQVAAARGRTMASCSRLADPQRLMLRARPRPSAPHPHPQPLSGEG
jgi:arginyl-tRNA synthetase